MKSIMKIHLAYTLTSMGSVLYYLTLAGALSLFLARNNSYPMHHHISNFSISYMLVTAFGLTVLYQRHAWRHIIAFSLLLLAANVLVESSVSVLNVPDMGDALSGCIGIICGIGFLGLLQRCFSHAQTDQNT